MPNVAIVAALERETLRARGPEAISWLNGLVTCDLRGVKPGAGAFGLLLTKTGKIQTDLDVVARPGETTELVLGLASGTAERMLPVLDAHLVMEDVELVPEPEWAWLRLLGHGALELARNFASDAKVLAEGSISGWLGSEAAALVVSRGDVESVARELAARGGPNARALSGEEWHALRMAHGLPLFGTDYTSEDNPHEAALDRRAVSWDKGCYLGQEVVCMQDMRGRVKRRLAVLRIPGDGAAALAGVPVLAADAADPVGEVRSAAQAEAGVTLAFAALRAPYFDAKDRALSVEGRPAEIVALSTP
jgi:folate-binding protein YgfZ